MIKLPKKVYLRAMKKHWRISYVHSPGTLTLIQLPYNQLVLYGNHYSKRSALHLISKWVMLKAKNYLSEQLRKMNRKVKVSYKKVIFPPQEAQWGSYSMSKTISLNYKLIFLPLSLVKHLLIHELCHAFSLYHSPTFWKRVEKFDKHWKKHRYLLGKADPFIPSWVITKKK
jgi:predicted metal-dependent hydrolase